VRTATDHRRRRAAAAAFSLPELIVVLGLIMLLLGLLAPAVSRAWRHAEAVKCRAQLRDIGMALVAYANDNHGVLYPFRGSTHDWPEVLYDEPLPEVTICPTRADENFMSYQLSIMVMHGSIRLEGNNSGGVPSSKILLAGESRTGYYDGFSTIDPETGEPSWDPARHGPGLLSNYLWLDFHVDNTVPVPIPPSNDPWYVPL
jgi:prepilin-type processing-associated H-X9-DG protein